VFGSATLSAKFGGFQCITVDDACETFRPFHKSILYAIQKYPMEDIPFFCWTEEWLLKETVWEEFTCLAAMYVTSHRN
jgi:hypothetical protein